MPWVTRPARAVRSPYSSSTPTRSRCSATSAVGGPRWPPEICRTRTWH